MRRAPRGFTLIEVMIVVAIVGILAAIAIPGFRQYSLKSRTSEAYVMIGGIRILQDTFIGTNDSYANIAAANPLGVPTGFKRDWASPACPGACSRLNPAACTEFTCVGFQPAGGTFYSYTSPSLAVGGGGGLNEMAIGALSDLDSDGAQAGYTYQTSNTGGSVGYVLDGITPCVVFMPSGTIIECRPGAF